MGGENVIRALQSGDLSAAARRRMEAFWGEPFLLADWLDALMIHVEVDPMELRRATPFSIDAFAGRAFVSLVFFEMRRMRPRRGGVWSERLFRPIATHRFLNVRTYVEAGHEPGIYFLAEWLPNPLSVLLGPTVFGLPYREGSFDGKNQPAKGVLAGGVVDANSGAGLRYDGRMDPEAKFEPCTGGSRDEWLMERYTAFTRVAGIKRRFRIWHPPWRQVSARVDLFDDGLLRANWPWLAEGKVVGANYSAGFENVWMGRPRFVPRPRACLRTPGPWPAATTLKSGSRWSGRASGC